MNGFYFSNLIIFRFLEKFLKEIFILFIFILKVLEFLIDWKVFIFLLIFNVLFVWILFVLVFLNFCCEICY